MFSFDENGWAEGPVEPLEPGDAFSLFSPEADGRIDEARFAHAAQAFFGARLTLATQKRYPNGAVPIADAFVLRIAPLRPDHAAASELTVVTLPLDRAREVKGAAQLAVTAIGGAGFDVLLTRAKRLFQVKAKVDAGDERAPLVAAAVLASVLLAPIVPPEGGAIFGVKGARLRLEALGWRT